MANLSLMEIPIQPSTVNETNALLRALWAAIRAEFGTLGWHFAPVKDGERKTIYFGWADLGLKQPVQVGVTYQRRGIATAVLFEDADEIGSRIRRCLDAALTASTAESTFIVTLGMSLTIHMADVAGRFIRLHSLDEGRTRVCLPVRGYDIADARAELHRRIRLVADVLSFLTNVAFRILMPNDDARAPDETIRNSDSTPDEDWIDGYPTSNDLLLVDEQGMNLLDALLADEIGEKVAMLADAAHHFHSGLVAELQQSELGLPGTNNEQATLFYLSALEVASLIGAPDPKTCETCSQPQYKIAARVKGFAMRHLGSTAAELVQSFYSSRSSYLHRGLLSSSRSYGGVTIPQLDPSSSNGVRAQLSLAPVHNLREFTSFCLRRVAKECLQTEAAQ
jgi:hypothetical protein